MSAPVSENKSPSLIERLPSLADVQRERCMRSLYYFAQHAWHVLEPGRQFKDNWHIQAICEHLQAVSEGQIHRLLINVPPRHMKSLLVSVMWPVWDWLRTPTRQFLTASYRDQLATRDALKSRQLIQSLWFQSLFGHLFTLSRDQNQKTRYQNDKMGYRIAITSMGGVGEGGDFLIADDPQNTDKMDSDPYVEATTDWWNLTFNQRLNDQNDGAIVLTMQRLSERDLSQCAIDEGGWEHLMLPAEYEPARACKTSLGFRDPRTEAGELLWPNRIGEAALAKMKKRLGTYGAAGQLQQRPAPAGGGIIKREGWRIIRRAELPEFFVYALSFDTAATEDEANDPTGATVWGLSVQPGKAGMFRLGQLEEWLQTPDLERRVPQFYRDWPTELNYKHGQQIYGAQLWIEAAGPTGLALVQLLQRKHPTIPITGLDPKKLGGDKNARARLAAVYIENGLVWLLDPRDDPTVPVFLDRADAFPKCKPRDTVDSAIQAILHGCTSYTFEGGAYEYLGSSSSADNLDEDDNDDADWYR